MLTQRARERASGSSGGKKYSTSGSRAPTKRKGIGDFVIPKLSPCCQDARLETSGREERRPVTYAESRPTGRGKGKRRDGRRERSPKSSSSGEYWKPPPSKSRRPEGFPEAGTGIFQSQPPPPEDDASGVGWDDSGMAPEVADVVLAEEYEDLNVHLIMMDRTSDSPHPTSPNQAAALDRALSVTIDNDGPDLDTVELEMGFLSTQVLEFARDAPASEPTTGPSKDTRKVERRSKGGQKGQETSSAPSDTHAKATVMPPPASPGSKSRRPRGRGLLCLRAPPKMTDEPALGRRPLSMDEPPTPQWEIPVPPTPLVTYRAPTPPLEDSQLFSSQPESSQFADADEDFRPLTGRWSDIVEEEERAMAATAAVSAVLATLPLPVETINVTVSAPSTPMETAATSVEPPLAAPTSIASLLLGQTTMMTEATVGTSSVSTDVTRTVTASSAAAAASAAPDIRRSLEDGDITYAVRLAPLPDVNTVTDALLSSYRTTLTRNQLQRIVRLLFDLLRDTSVFLTERIFVARLTDQPSDEILEEILRLLRRFTAGERRQ